MAFNTGYCEEYDSYYYANTCEWVEEKCEDSDCAFCNTRPPKYDGAIEKKKEIVYRTAGDISVTEVIGALEIAKLEILDEQKE